MDFKKDFKKHKKLIIFFSIFLLVTIPLSFSQVVQTQVIDLSEKARDFFIEATKGNIQGQETVSKFAHFTSLNEVDMVDVQSQGGNLVFMQVADTLDLVSTSAADTVGGANASLVKLTGLDENFSEITEEINLSGLIPVTTVKEFIRVNKFEVIQVGNFGSVNDGTISATSSIAGLQIEIEPSSGKDQNSHYTVPLGRNIIITSMSFTVATDKFANAFLFIRNNGDQVTAPFSPEILIREVHGINIPVQFVNTANLRFDEKTDIWFRAIGDTSDIEIEVNYDILQYTIGT